MEKYKYGIPVAELFGCFGSDFRKRLFAMFAGHMDDSRDTKSGLFILSCVIGWGGQWFWIENLWRNLLERVNKRLVAQGRRAISRYHAADCNGSFSEFAGWTQEERQELHEKILGIFSRHPLAVVSYAINLNDLVAEFPEAKEKPENVAVILLLNRIMVEIGARIFEDKRYVKDRIALIHDRGEYDAVLLDAFNYMRSDQLFKHRERFTTIAPMGWEDCVPLQPADFLAYEHFKAVLREPAGHKRRKTLEILLTLPSFGGVGSSITRQGVKEMMSRYDKKSKKILLENARISTVRKSPARATKHTAQRDKGRARRRKRGKKAEEV